MIFLHIRIYLGGLPREVSMPVCNENQYCGKNLIKKNMLGLLQIPAMCDLV